MPPTISGVGSTGCASSKRVAVENSVSPPPSHFLLLPPCNHHPYSQGYFASRTLQCILSTPNLSPLFPSLASSSGSGYRRSAHNRCPQFASLHDPSIQSASSIWFACNHITSRPASLGRRNLVTFGHKYYAHLSNLLALLFSLSTCHIALHRLVSGLPSFLRCART